MHGITKELEKLAPRIDEAARAGNENPYPPDKTEHAYYNALRAQGGEGRLPHARSSSTSSRAPPRAASTASCLAKALALDAPQDGLRDLWLTKGAILKLLSRCPEAAAARREPDAEVARRRLQRDGRARAGLARCRRGSR